MANTQRDVVTLDRVRYRVFKESGIDENTQSQWAAKITTGDTDRDSDPIRSTLGFSDLRGGINQENIEGAGDVNRTRWSTHDTRYQGHMLHPPLAIGSPSKLKPRQTSIPIPNLPGVARDISFMIEFYGDEIVCFGDKVARFLPESDTWASPTLQHTLPGTATSGIVIRLGDSRQLYLIICCGDAGYAYATYNETTQAITWANVTNHAATWMQWWDYRIWSLDNSGQLAKAPTPDGEWTNDAWLPVPDGYATNLFTFVADENLLKLYAVSKDGNLWQHDAVNQKFIKTRLDLPFHPETGLGAVGWEGTAYVSSGTSITRYALRGGGQAVADQVGPDQDAGLPFGRSGTIVQLLRGQRSLIALVRGIKATPNLAMTPGPGDPFRGPMRLTDNAFASTILEHTGSGWQVLWAGGQDGVPDPTHPPITYGHLAETLGGVRLWWGAGQQLWYIKLPIFINNPQNLPDREFCTFSETITPWFNANIIDARKVAVGILLEHSNLEMSAPETGENKVQIWVAYDYHNVWFPVYPKQPSGNPYDDPLDLQALDGHLYLPANPYHIPHHGDEREHGGREGVPFKAISFLVRTWVGANQRISPDVRSITLEYYKRLATEQKYEYSVTIDLANPFDRRSPYQLRQHLKSVVDRAEMVNFSYEPDDVDLWVLVLWSNRHTSAGRERDDPYARLQLIEV